MSYELITQALGAGNANKKVKVTDSTTSAPAIILTAATGGHVWSSDGNAYSDASGNVSVYIDSSQTWTFTVVDTSTSVVVKPLTLSQETPSGEQQVTTSGGNPTQVPALTIAQSTAGATGVIGGTGDGKTLVVLKTPSLVKTYDLSNLIHVFTPEQFSAVGDGSTPDVTAFQDLAAAISSAGKPCIVYLENSYFLPAGILDFSSLSNVTFKGPGKLVGPAVTSHGIPTSFIKLWGTLSGTPVTLSSAIASGVSSFTCTNTFVAGDFLLLSNFPADATDAATDGTADGLGRIPLTYADTSTSNLRSTRRKEILKVKASDGTSVTTFNQTVNAYSDTTSLQLEKISPVKNIVFECGLENIYLSTVYSDGVEVMGTCVNSYLESSCSTHTKFSPAYFDAGSTACRVVVLESSLFPKVKGHFSGGDFSSTGPLVKLIGAINFDVDVVFEGSDNSTSPASGVEVNTEFSSNWTGYPSLPTTGGSVRVNGRSLAGGSVLISCDPWYSLASKVIVDDQSESSDVSLIGAEEIQVIGRPTSISIQGSHGVYLTNFEGTLAESTLTDPRSSAVRSNQNIQGVWLNWVPAVEGDTTTGTVTYSDQYGRYIRQGSRVYLEGNVAWTATSGSAGNLVVSGLPYPASSTAPYGSVTISEWTGLTGTNGLTARVNSGASTLKVLYGGNTEQTVPSTGLLQFSGSYTV